jgi:phosphoadenosine phosphosulfate reductase
MEKPVLWSIPTVELSAAQMEARAHELTVRLRSIVAQHKDVRFATSLAAEDMVLTHAIARAGLGIQLFTLDTGRLHQETLDFMATIEHHYGITIRKVAPRPGDVEAYIAKYGLNGFYESEAAKKACCEVRKVIPLNAALSGADAWLSGQRREQAVTRAQLEFEERDEARGMAKFNPLFDWSEAEVWSYLKQEQVPIHPLHLRGYPSIGCEPCTRAVKAGEDIRAGRWWWLQQDSKECGLHVK